MADQKEVCGTPGTDAPPCGSRDVASVEATAALTFKGSPGPWTTDHTCFDARIPIRGGVTAYGRPYVIAHINRPGSAFSGQDKANAALIAAAPELLAVLQSLMPGTLIGESYDPPVPDDELLKEFLFTWGKLRAARAAIAKALGGDA